MNLSPLQRKLTPEERAAAEQECANAAREGRSPFDWKVPERPAPAVTAEADPLVFTAEDLCGSILQRCLPYEIPGTGKRVYVFGLGTSDTELMLDWALRRHEDPDEDRPGQITGQARLQDNCKIAQVILSCYKGPDRRAGRCFSLADFAAVKKHLPYAAVNAVCALSDELSGSDEALGPGVRRFFGAVRDCLLTSPSPSDTSDAFPSGWHSTRTRLLSLVSRALSLGKLDSGTLDALEG